MRDMDILPGIPGSGLPYDEGIRRELDEILDRLGRVIGRRLMLKGFSEADAFLRVAEALLELARQLRDIDDRDRWLIEFLDLGPYDPEAIAREVEADGLDLDLERKARDAEARTLKEIDLERQIWMARKLSPGSRGRTAAGPKRRSSGLRAPRPLEPL